MASSLPSIIVCNVGSLYQRYSELVNKVLDDEEFQQADCIVLTETQANEQTDNGKKIRDGEGLKLKNDVERLLSDRRKIGAWPAARQDLYGIPYIKSVFHILGWSLYGDEGSDVGSHSFGVMWLVRKSWEDGRRPVFTQRRRIRLFHSVGFPQLTERYMEILHLRYMAPERAGESNRDQPVELIGHYNNIFGKDHQKAHLSHQCKGKLIKYVGQTCLLGHQPAILVAGTFQRVSWNSLAMRNNITLHSHTSDQVVTFMHNSITGRRPVKLTLDVCFSDHQQAYHFPRRLNRINTNGQGHFPVFLKKLEDGENGQDRITAACDRLHHQIALFFHSLWRELQDPEPLGDWFKEAVIEKLTLDLYSYRKFQGLSSTEELEELLSRPINLQPGGNYLHEFNLIGKVCHDNAAGERQSVYDL